jgi:hypothetical protein
VRGGIERSGGSLRDLPATMRATALPVFKSLIIRFRLYDLLPLSGIYVYTRFTASCVAFDSYFTGSHICKHFDGCLCTSVLIIIAFADDVLKVTAAMKLADRLIKVLNVR